MVWERRAAMWTFLREWCCKEACKMGCGCAWFCSIHNTQQSNQLDDYSFMIKKVVMPWTSVSLLWYINYVRKSSNYLLQLFQIQSNSNFEFDLLQTFADWQTLKFSKHTILLFKIGFMTVNTEQRMQVLIEKEVKVNE